MKYFIVFAAFLITVLVPTAGQAATVIEWQDAVLEARQNNPDLAAAEEVWEGSKADRTIAASGLFPQISASVSADRSKSSSSSLSSSDVSGLSGASRSTSSSSSRDTYSYGISGSQLIFDAFKTFDDVEQAALNVDANQFNYEVTSSNVRLNLRLAFIDLLKAQEQLHLAEEIAKRRGQSEELIQLSYDAGREHKGSFLTSQANRAQANFEVEQAKRNILIAQRRLSTHLGRDHFEPFEAAGDLNLISEEFLKPDIENLALTTPLLQRLIVLKEAAKWGVKSVQASFFPSVYADASIGRRASDWPPDETDWSIGFSASVPVFEGGNRTAQLTKAGASLRQAEAEERSGRNGVFLILEETWSAFRDAAEQVDVQRRFLSAATERSRIAESEYSTGLITFNDWIIIEDNLVNAKKAYLNARAGLLAAEAEWRQAKGETLDEI